ncbi:MAG: hypothetical protein JKY61_10240 [Planctomycetes bacterium]|nr:hypothetical protein [Planctomycetota bacterium]
MLKSRPTKSLLGLPLAGLICLAGAWSLSAAFPTQEPASPDQAPHEAAEEHTELQLGMKTMYRSMKAMRPMLRDFAANQTSIIKIVESLEGALIVGLSQAPPRPDGEMSDSEWIQYQITYRQKINTALGVVLSMELAAHKGEAETVIEMYRSLGRHKKDGHGSFKLD